MDTARALARLAAAAAAIVAFAGAAPALAAAQGGAGGFWAELGLGPGWGRIACDICDAGRATGLSGHLGLGGQLGGRIRLGAEADVWTSRADGVPERLIGIAAVAQWQTRRPSPLRVKAGIAFLTYRVDDDVDVVTASGIGPVLGVAYEWALSPRVGLGPYATLVIGTIAGQVSFNGTQVQDAANLTLLHVGAAVTWR